MRRSPYVAFLYTLLFLMTMNSCSNLSRLVSFTPDHEGLHPEIYPYIEAVYEMSNGCLGGRVKHAGFFKEVPSSGNEESSVVGMANWILPSLAPQIRIDKGFWRLFSEKQKFFLVAHELYHAELPYFGHIKGEDSYGCSNHFMHPHVQSSACAVLKYNEYIKQMRQPCK